MSKPIKPRLELLKLIQEYKHSIPHGDIRKEAQRVHDALARFPAPVHYNCRSIARMMDINFPKITAPNAHKFKNRIPKEECIEMSTWDKVEEAIGWNPVK